MIVSALCLGAFLDNGVCSELKFKQSKGKVEGRVLHAEEIVQAEHSSPPS